MPEPKSASLTRLEEISAVLGVPVNQFETKSALGDLSAFDDYLRLWSLLKTENARRQVLDAVRRLVDQEAA